jgi:thiosulfate reductase cytochrome b subunit
MKTVVHTGSLRMLHAVNAIAVVGLLLSGLEIYRAAPFFVFSFPAWLSLGGDMKGAIRWHFTFMWILTINAFAYAVLRLAARRALVAMFPLSAKELWSTGLQAARLKLTHRADEYNAIQKWMYVGVWLLLTTLILSGIALWKPVQLSTLSTFFGGYETTRRVHFVAMVCVLIFVVIHVMMALVVPRTFTAITLGLERLDDSGELYER